MPAPAKPPHSQKEDVQLLLNQFVLRVQAGALLSFATFKSVWAELKFTLIFEGFKGSLEPHQYVQSLFAAALDALDQPLPFIQPLSSDAPSAQPDAAAAASTAAQSKSAPRTSAHQQVPPAVVSQQYAQQAAARGASAQAPTAEQAVTASGHLDEDTNHLMALLGSAPSATVAAAHDATPLLPLPDFDDVLDAMCSPGAASQLLVRDELPQPALQQSDAALQQHPVPADASPQPQPQPQSTSATQAVELALSAPAPLSAGLLIPGVAIGRREQPSSTAAQPSTAAPLPEASTAAVSRAMPVCLEAQVGAIFAVYTLHALQPPPAVKIYLPWQQLRVLAQEVVPQLKDRGLHDALAAVQKLLAGGAIAVGAVRGSSAGDGGGVGGRLGQAARAGDAAVERDAKFHIHSTLQGMAGLQRVVQRECSKYGEHRNRIPGLADLPPGVGGLGQIADLHVGGTLLEQVLEMAQEIEGAISQRNSKKKKKKRKAPPAPINDNGEINGEGDVVPASKAAGVSSGRPAAKGTASKARKISKGKAARADNAEGGGDDDWDLEAGPEEDEADLAGLPKAARLVLQKQAEERRQLKAVGRQWLSKHSAALAGAAGQGSAAGSTRRQPTSNAPASGAAAAAEAPQAEEDEDEGGVPGGLAELLGEELEAELGEELEAELAAELQPEYDEGAELPAIVASAASDAVPAADVGPVSRNNASGISNTQSKSRSRTPAPQQQRQKQQHAVPASRSEQQNGTQDGNAAGGKQGERKRAAPNKPPAAAKKRKSTSKAAERSAEETPKMRGRPRKQPLPNVAEQEAAATQETGAKRQGSKAAAAHANGGSLGQALAASTFDLSALAADAAELAAAAAAAMEDD